METYIEYCTLKIVQIDNPLGKGFWNEDELRETIKTAHKGIYLCDGKYINHMEIMYNKLLIYKTLKDRV